MRTALILGVILAACVAAEAGTFVSAGPFVPAAPIRDDLLDPSDPDYDPTRQMGSFYLPQPRFIPGKEFTDAVTNPFTGVRTDKDDLAVADALQCLFWDGTGGTVDTHDLGHFGVSGSNVDAMANKSDKLANYLVGNYTTLHLSFEGDGSIYYSFPVSPDRDLPSDGWTTKHDVTRTPDSVSYDVNNGYELNAWFGQVARGTEISPTVGDTTLAKETNGTPGFQPDEFLYDIQWNDLNGNGALEEGEPITGVLLPEAEVPLEMRGVWVGPSGIDNYGVTDIDSLELWGADGPAKNNADAYLFSIEGDPGGVAVWDGEAAMKGTGSVVPLLLDTEVAYAIGRTDLADVIDLDALMSWVDPDTGVQTWIFSIAPVDVFDGGEIWVWRRENLGSQAVFLEHGGLTWNTALDVQGLFGGASENVNALEANMIVAYAWVPLPGAAWAGLGLLALLGVARRLRRRR